MFLRKRIVTWLKHVKITGLETAEEEKLRKGGGRWWIPANSLSESSGISQISVSVNYWNWHQYKELTSLSPSPSSFPQQQRPPPTSTLLYNSTSITIRTNQINLSHSISRSQLFTILPFQSPKHEPSACWPPSSSAWPSWLPSFWSVTPPLWLMLNQN
jgi:hypothetical protein